MGKPSPEDKIIRVSYSPDKWVEVENLPLEIAVEDGMLERFEFASGLICTRSEAKNLLQ